MQSWINPKITVNATHGKGLGSFANSKISRGEAIIVQGGKILSYKEIQTSEYKPFSDHCFQVEDGLLICPYEPKQEKMDGVFHVNHSCEPNCGFKGQIVMVAMRDIEAGEEITYDYAMTDANRGDVTCSEMNCLCAKENCRRVVTGDDWQNQELQKKYAGFFSFLIQKMIEENY